MTHPQDIYTEKTKTKQNKNETRTKCVANNMLKYISSLTFRSFYFNSATTKKITLLDEDVLGPSQDM